MKIKKTIITKNTNYEDSSSLYDCTAKIMRKSGKDDLYTVSLSHLDLGVFERFRGKPIVEVKDDEDGMLIKLSDSIEYIYLDYSQWEALTVLARFISENGSKGIQNDLYEI